MRLTFNLPCDLNVTHNLGCADVSLVGISFGRSKNKLKENIISEEQVL
jgi:hypothetical protein